MIAREEIGNKGILIAAIIIFLWLFVFVFALTNSITELGFWSVPLILLLTQLFTGIFITAHDAMHGTIYTENKKINQAFGVLCASIFAFNSYNLMYKNHHAHHAQPVSNDDPDFHHSLKFFPWLYSFISHYFSWKQLVLTAIFFNFLWLALHVPIENLLLFYVLPMVLSTLQLFYFGTYQPHKGMHTNLHKSGTQTKNHVWGFLSCYFFGYHYEHHEQPYLPWWKLYKAK